MTKVEKKLTLDPDEAILTRTDVRYYDIDGMGMDEELNIKTYDYSVPYAPGKYSVEFYSWVNFIFGKQDNQTPKTHFMIVDHMFGSKKLVQTLAHRGMGKSVVISGMVPLYVAYKGGLPGFGKVENLVLFSDTISQAQEHLANMRLAYEQSDELQQVLTLVDDKRIKPKVDVLVFDNVNGNRIYIQAKGAGESMRGTRKGKVRPQLLIFDDIMNDDILTSEIARKKLHTWFFATVSGSVDISHYKYMVIGTPMTEADILGLMRTSKKWHTLELPVAMDVNVSQADIVSSWKDRFSPAVIKEKYDEFKSMGAESEFYREMMLQVTNDELALFKTADFKYFSYAELKDNFPKMLFFTSIDLAISREEYADFTAVMTIAVDHNHNWYVVRVDHGRWDVQESLDTLMSHIKAYNPLKLGVEKATHQQVFNDIMQHRFIKEQVALQVHHFTGNSKIKKEYRIGALKPRFVMGQIHFRDDNNASVRELEHELKMMTREACLARHDDVADVLAGMNDEGFVVYPGNFVGSEVKGDGFDMGEYTDSYF